MFFTVETDSLHGICRSNAGYINGIWQSLAAQTNIV